MRRNFTILQFTTVTYFGKYTLTWEISWETEGGNCKKVGIHRSVIALFKRSGTRRVYRISI